MLWFRSQELSYLTQKSVCRWPFQSRVNVNNFRLPVYFRLYLNLNLRKDQSGDRFNLQSRSILDLAHVVCSNLECCEEQQKYELYVTLCTFQSLRNFFFLLWTKEGGGAGADVKSGFGACEAPLCSTDAEVVLLVECFFLFCNLDDGEGHKYLPTLLNTLPPQMRCLDGRSTTPGLYLSPMGHLCNLLSRPFARCVQHLISGI